jgi:hypothetical protein
MAEAYLDGLIDVENLPADSRPGDWGERLVRNHPNAAALQTVSQRLKRKKTVDHKFHLYELGRWPGKAFLDMVGNAAAGTTTLVVDDGTGNGTARYFQKGTLIRVGSDPSSGEILRVVTDPTSATQIEVARSFGATAAAQIDDDETLLIIGHADAEASDSPNGRVRTPSDRYNYTQIFQTPYRLTRRARSTATRFGEPIKTMTHADALIQHAKERERAMLYGEAVEETDASEGIRSATGGITTVISTHVHDGSSTNFTVGNFEDWMGDMRGDGSEERLAFTGKSAYKAVIKMVKNEATQMLEPATNKWGFRLKRLITVGPDLLLMEHPEMDEIDPGGIIIIDPANLVFRFMNDPESGNSDFKHEVVEMDNNNQVSKWQFYSDCGLQLQYELAFGYIKGITDFTAP